MNFLHPGQHSSLFVPVPPYVASVSRGLEGRDRPIVPNGLILADTD